MTESKTKIYTPEFKEAAVKLAIESEQPIARTARELGVIKATLYEWIRKYSKPKGSIKGTDEHLYDELKRLKKDLARVIQERDLLKKAAAYFAKESH